MDATRGWAELKADYDQALRDISKLSGHDQTILSAAEVNADRLELVKDIFSDFAALGSTLERYETIIHKRWLKKTKEQRRVVVQKAWMVEMAQCHRPDWNFVHKFTILQQQKDR